MLTENTQRYVLEYLSGRGMNHWETVSRSSSIPFPHFLADDVAHLQFYGPHVTHFTETWIRDNVDIAFGILDTLKERGIEAIVQGTVYTLHENDPDRDFHIRNPRSSLTILNKNAWIVIAQTYGFSREALFSDSAFSSAYETYKMFCRQSPPGYVDISLYANLDKLSSTYTTDGLVIITKEEIQRRKEEASLFRSALSTGNVTTLTGLLQDLVPDLPPEAVEEVATLLVLSSDSDKRNNDEQ